MSHETGNSHDSSLPEPSIETGEYNISSVVDNFGEDAVNVQEINFDNEVALKQLSEYKYASLFGMFREYLANAEATTIEAKESLDDGYNPLIHVGYYREQATVQIVDNGMGMEKQIIEEISDGGKTTNWSQDNRPGRYGIGRFSAFKGVGTDGGFYMETRSRRTDERTMGFWTGNNFIELENVEARMDEDQYGTFFEFPLRESTDVREHVSRAAWWFEIPVQYTEYDGSNTPVIDDEYGGTKFLENANPNHVVVFENKYVKAVNAPNRRSNLLGNEMIAGVNGDNGMAPDVNTTILDIPIKGNRNRNWYSLPYRNVYVRIKKESRYVVDNSEHVGKIVLSRADYQDKQNDDDSMEKYVVEDDVEQNAVILPMPAGDRDRLQKNPTFWEWLETNLSNEYSTVAEKFVEQSKNGTEYRDIDATVRAFFMHSVKHQNAAASSNARNASRIKNAIDSVESYSDMTFDDEVRTVIHDLFQTVTVYGDNDESGNVTCTLQEVLEEKVSKDATVFLSYVSPSDKKSNVVWEDEKNHVIIKVSNSDLYNDYEERYDWRKLKTITEETIDEFDVSPETKSKFSSEPTKSKTAKNAGKSPQNRELTVHLQRGSKKSTLASVSWNSSRYTRIVDEVKETIQNTDSRINRLILVPSNSEYQISNVRELVSHRTCYAARCSVKTADYLTQFDDIQTIEEAIDEYYSTTVTTSEGDYEWDELTRKFANIIVHVPVDDEIGSLVTTQSGMEIAKQEFISIWDDERNEENTVYVPLDTETLERVHTGTAIVDPPTSVYFMHKTNIDDDSHRSVYFPSDRFSHKKVFSNPTWLFVAIRLEHLRDTEVYESLRRKKYDGKIKAIVDMLCEVDATTAQEIVEERL